MSKPTPQAEIVITSIGNPLHITTNSPDAYQFVKQHAPDFGSYYEPTFESWHTLFVRAGYDIADVAAYLQAMGSESTE